MKKRLIIVHSVSERASVPAARESVEASQSHVRRQQTFGSAEVGGGKVALEEKVPAQSDAFSRSGAAPQRRSAVHSCIQTD